MIVDWSVLESIAAGNTALRNRLLGLFVHDSEQDLRELNGHLDQRRFDLARLVAHRLAGAARTVGATEVGVCAGELEHPRLYDKPAELARRRLDLEKGLGDVHDAIRKLGIEPTS